MVKKNDKIFVAGHRGLVGSAVLRKLKKLNYSNIITVEKKSLDLLDQKKVFNFFKRKKIKSLIICAAKVGGIKANNIYKADFIYENLTIQNNLIHGAKINNISNLIFLGSSCVYPRLCKQPIKEQYLLNGELEKTNEAYAVAKIAGIKMCESYNRQYGKSHDIDYRSIMPTNLYGPGDNFDPENAMVIPTLMSRIYNGEDPVVVWGDGSAIRDFAYTRDVAEGTILALHHGTGGRYVNLGSGVGVSIKELVETLHDFLGFNYQFDTSKPSGFPRRIMDVSLARDLIDYNPSTTLRDGLESTWKWFLENQDEFKHKKNYFSEKN